MCANETTQQVMDRGQALPPRETATNDTPPLRVVAVARNVCWLIDVLLIAMVGWGTSALLA